MSEPFFQLTPSQLKQFGIDCAREGAQIALGTLSRQHSDVLRLVEKSGAHKTVFNTREAAVYASVSTSTIRKWIAEGMPSTKRGGQAGHTVTRTDLDAWRTTARPTISE